MIKQLFLIYITIVILLLIYKYVRKKKIIICFFGTCSRSIKYTHKNLKDKLINIVKKEYEVDIYIFNNNVEGEKIDDVIQNNHDVKLLQSDFYQEETQSYIDEFIKNNFNLYESKKMGFQKRYNRIQKINAIRQMYSEEKIGNFLNKNKDNYGCAIVCGPDYYLLDNINLEHINNSINNYNSIYTTNVNDAGGYTNGIYIGSLYPLIKILKRFSILEKLLPTDKDYEYLLKKTFDMYNIKRLITDTKFIKIRSNKHIARQGSMKSKNYDKEIDIIKDKINKIS